MKKSFLFLCLMAVAVALSSVSCEHISDSDAVGGKKSLTFSTFTLEEGSYENVTKAAVSDVITKLDFALYTLDGSTYTLYRLIRQDNADDGFGSIRVEDVDYGEYAVVVIGHKCSVHATMDSPQAINFGGKVAETFSYYAKLTVNGATATSQQVELNRVTSKFKIWCNDTQPVDIKTFEFVVSGGSTLFDATRGLAPAADADDRTVTIDGTSYSGVADVVYSFQTFLPSTEASITVEANAKNSAGEVLYSNTFEDAPMKVNRETIYRGDFYVGSSVPSFSVTINDEWDTPYQTTF